MSDMSGAFEMEVELPAPQGGPAGDTQTPYHILLIADFAGGKNGTVSGPLADRVVAVTPPSFDAVLAQAAPTTRFTLADPTATGSVMAEVNLKLDSLKAMNPRSVAEQLPACQALLAIRAKVVERMRGNASAEQIKSAVAAAASANAGMQFLVEAIHWTPGAPAADANAVDGLLSQLDLGDAESPATAPPSRTPLGAVVAAAAGGGTSIPAEEASAMRRTIAEIDKRLSAWLTTVLHSSQVQAIESAWRSAAFITSHTDFRKGVQLSLLHSSKEALVDRLTTLLIDPVFDEGAPAPDLIVVGMEFGNTAPDMEILDTLAQNAASLPAVAIAGASPEFLGVKHAWQVPTLPNVIAMFDQWQFAKWKTLRGEPYARMLALIFGRCLLRTAYGTEEEKDLEFHYREECLADKDLVWAPGSIAVACTAAASFAAIGWPTAVSGFSRGRIEGFATAQGGKKGDKKFGPTDTLMPQPKIEELAFGGLNAVVGVRDHDDAIVWNGLTAARPVRLDANGMLEVSLPYQIFAARLSTLLLALQPQLKGLPPEKVQATVSGALREWLGIQGEPTPEQFQVQVGMPDEGPQVLQLGVSVTPPPNILPGGIPVVLGYSLR